MDSQLHEAGVADVVQTHQAQRFGLGEGGAVGAEGAGAGSGRHFGLPPHFGPLFWLFFSAAVIWFGRFKTDLAVVRLAASHAARILFLPLLGLTYPVGVLRLFLFLTVLKFPLVGGELLFGGNILFPMLLTQ